MTTATLLLLTGLAAFLTATCLTPVIRSLARKHDLVDHPDPDRKLHDRAVPLGGGIAIFFATLVGVAIALLIQYADIYDFTKEPSSLLGLLFAATVVCAIGLLDDARGLRGRQKLIGQIGAVAILISSGLMIKQVAIFDWQLTLGLAAIPFTAFWLMGAINSVNLLDGADGLATTLGIIMALTLSVLAAHAHHTLEATVAAALTGALLAFLLFNFPPASIFLGDAGSTLIGLTIGALAIQASLKGPATIALAAPLAILAIPILDSTAAIARRVLTGRSIFATDRAHLHHVLLRRGIGPRRMLTTIGILSIITAAGALASVYTQHELYAVLSAAAVVGMLATARIFGHAEFALLAHRAKTLGGSFFRIPRVEANGHGNGHHTAHETTIRLQGSRDWGELWNTLTDFAEQHQLTKVQLDLNLSWAHEAYHATWQREGNFDTTESWLTRLPLTTAGRTLGRLEFTGHQTDTQAYTLLPLIAELLDTLDPCIHRVCEELSPKEVTPL